MAKANKDGWIRHRGGKCPVENGALIDVRLRDGRIVSSEFQPMGFDWRHTGERWNVMAYRIHKQEQQPAPTQTPESLRARYIAAGEEIRANEVTIEARKAEIAQLEKEREELREKVRAMGFDFWDATRPSK